MGAKPVMSLAGGSIVGLFTAAAVWGLGFGGVPTTVLTWGARTERPASSSSAASRHSAAQWCFRACDE